MKFNECKMQSANDEEPKIATKTSPIKSFGDRLRHEENLSALVS